jgi:hypothetical protein
MHRAFLRAFGQSPQVIRRNVVRSKELNHRQSRLAPMAHNTAKPRPGHD